MKNKTPTEHGRRKGKGSRLLGPNSSRFHDIEKPATSRDLQFLDPGIRPGDWAHEEGGEKLKNIGDMVKEVQTVAEIDNLMKLLEAKKRMKLSSLPKPIPSSSSSPTPGNESMPISEHKKGEMNGLPPGPPSDEILSDILEKQRQKMEELWKLQSLYSDCLKTVRGSIVGNSEKDDVEVKTIHSRIKEIEGTSNLRCRAPVAKMFLSEFNNSMRLHTPVHDERSSSTGQCSHEQSREDAMYHSIAKQKLQPLRPHHPEFVSDPDDQKNAKRMHRRAERRRQHRRDYGRSPGNMLFTPQPDVPPLNLDVIHEPVEPAPLSSAWPTDSAHVSAQRRKQHLYPKRIAKMQATSDTHLRILSPRAKTLSQMRHSDRCSSPDLTKCVESILSPRSAFSKTSRSAGSNSAFSTPTSTPRSARYTGMSHSYAMVAKYGLSQSHSRNH
eukprot:g713.t1